jgi:hemerythrin-like domain-containing protein
MSTTGPLTERNMQIHEELDALLLQGLEALTAMQLEESHRCFIRLAESLQRHAATEDAQVLPQYERIGEFPRGASLEILIGEHGTLERLANRAVTILDELRHAPTPSRREMVRHLHEFLRLRALLEHHTLRETTLMYPVLDQHLADHERKVIERALNTPLHER